MDKQTEPALDSEQAGEHNSGTADSTGTEFRATAPHDEHAILDEFLSGADQGYMRPSADKPQGLTDWLKRARSKSVETVGLWSPPWLAGKARHGGLQTSATSGAARPSEMPTLTSTATADEQSADGQWPSRPVTAWASSALTVAAVLVAAAALWMSAGLNSELDGLRSELAQLKKAALHPIASETDLELLALEARVDSLQAKVNEATWDTPEFSAAPDQEQGRKQDQQQAQQQARQQEILTRIAELEQIATLWEQQQMAAAQQAATAPPPASSPAEPVTTAATIDQAATSSIAAASTPTTATDAAETTDKRQTEAAPTAPPATTAVAAASKPPKPAKSSKATSRRNGPWVVNLLSVSSRSEAKREIKRLKKMDIQAEIQTAKVKQQTWYRIQVTGFATSSEAQDFGDRIAVQTGLKGAWAARK